MQGKEITITLTSCGRFDLLIQTIQSIIDFWDGDPPVAFYINEDSGTALPIAVRLFIQSVWSECNYVEFSGNKNQIAAIDRMYKEVQTPYIFHFEDDWEFTKSGFIAKSLDILESDPKICNVWIRKPNDRNGHPAFGSIRKANNGTMYQLMSPYFAGGKFRGFSFNPGLRRLSDYQLIGPYSSITTFDPHQPLKSEMAVGQAYFRKNFRAATLLDGYCVHLGQNRHVSA